MLKFKTVYIVLVVFFTGPLALSAQTVVEDRLQPTALRLSIDREVARVSRLAVSATAQRGVLNSGHRCSIKKAMVIGAVVGATAGAVAGSIAYDHDSDAKWLPRGFLMTFGAGLFGASGAGFGAWWCR